METRLLQATSDTDKLYAPVGKLSVEQIAQLPPCLYQVGWLREGEDVYPCPRCSFVFNSPETPPKCRNCGLQAVEETCVHYDKPTSPLSLLSLPAPDADVE